jgi:hypothetical protein
MGTSLIAETDQDGRIAHVWHWPHDQRCARPIGAGKIRDDELRIAEFVGAPKERILCWIEAAGVRASA